MDSFASPVARSAENLARRGAAAGASSHRFRRTIRRLSVSMRPADKPGNGGGLSPPSRRPAHFVLQGLVGPIGAYETARPHLLDCVQQFCPVSILTDRETRPDLPAEAMPLAGSEGDAKAAFAIHKTGDVRCDILGKEQGRRVMKPGGSIQGRHSLSRYGDRLHDLTLGITRGAPACAGGASPI